MSYLIRYACFLRIFFLNPIIHIASISPSVKHAAIFFSPATRSSFKTVYEDSGTEGGPILCQRLLHRLFKPSVESGDLRWIASLPLPLYCTTDLFFYCCIYVYNLLDDPFPAPIHILSHLCYRCGILDASVFCHTKLREVFVKPIVSILLLLYVIPSIPSHLCQRYC